MNQLVQLIPLILGIIRAAEQAVTNGNPTQEQLDIVRAATQAKVDAMNAATAPGENTNG